MSTGKTQKESLPLTKSWSMTVTTENTTVCVIWLREPSMRVTMECHGTSLDKSFSLTLGWIYPNQKLRVCWKLITEFIQTLDESFIKALSENSDKIENWLTRLEEEEYSTIDGLKEKESCSDRHMLIFPSLP